MIHFSANFKQVRRILHILMILVVICSSSSHLVVLQVIAWGGMLVENVQEEDLPDAIAKTFDGQHPCGLCDAIEVAADVSGDEPDHAPMLNVQVLDLKLLPIERLVVLPPAPGRLGIEEEQFLSEMRPASPVVPPPRFG